MSGFRSSPTAVGFGHKKSARPMTVIRSRADAQICPRYSFAKENGLRFGKFVFVFPVRFVHCKYNTLFFKRKYCKGTIFVLKRYYFCTISNQTVLVKKSGRITSEPGTIKIYTLQMRYWLSLQNPQPMSNLSLQ